MSAKEPDPFILFSDSALSELEHDAFDLEKKLGVIRSAILNPKTETPFTVMVTGGWGSGKTSAMAWLQKDLEARAKKAGDDEIKADTCWFYPWKYQNQEDVWRGLISEVILAAIDFENVDAAKVVKAAKQFGSFLGRGFVRILSSVKINAKAKDPIGAVELGADFDLKEALGGVIEEYGKSVTPQEAYFNEFESVLKKWVADSYPKSGNKRLVIFIDDLDRCLPKIALQVLEALKLYLNIPNLIFVVGVDTTVIKHIVAKSYCDMVGEKAMEGSFKEKAAKYLDKMFQVEINVEPTDHEIKSFFEHKVEKSNAWRSVPEDIRNTIKILLTDEHQGLSDRTPRTLIRQINRLLTAAQRNSGEGSLSRSQLIQREMIDLVCQEAGFGENLPQRNLRGRLFFQLWSDILQKHLDDIKSGSLASYLPSSELKEEESNRQKKFAQDQEGIATGFGVDVVPAQKATNRFDFSHLDALRHPDYATYEKLLTSAPLARLLEIPYAVTKEEAVSDLEIVRGWLAAKRGIQPDRIPDQEILDLQELDISSQEIYDLSPLSGITKLKALNCFDTYISDLTTLIGITQLEYLDCSYTFVSSLSPLMSLTSLKTLNCQATTVTKQEVAKLRKALPNCKIYSDFG